MHKIPVKWWRVLQMSPAPVNCITSDKWPTAEANRGADRKLVSVDHIVLYGGERCRSTISKQYGSKRQEEVIDGMRFVRNWCCAAESVHDHLSENENTRDRGCQERSNTYNPAILQRICTQNTNLNSRRAIKSL